MKLSEKAWEKSSKIIESIKKHPFNLELAKGTLDLDKFAYYIEQDVIYLQAFARCHAIIASKISIEHVRTFLRYSDNTFVAEQEVVHRFFKKLFNFQETGLITPATLSYTSYMLHMCTMEAVEVGIASILPCIWVYREVGLSIVKHADKSNKFARWIENYASDDFGAKVNEAISIFDEYGAKTSDENRDKMLDAFYKSTCLEWHFWNDSYNKTVFDNV